MKSAGRQRDGTGAIPSPRAAKGHVDCSILTLVDTVVVESASKLTRKKSPTGLCRKQALFARGLRGIGRGSAEGLRELYQPGTKRIGPILRLLYPEQPSPADAQGRESSCRPPELDHRKVLGLLHQPREKVRNAIFPPISDVFPTAFICMYTCMCKFSTSSTHVRARTSESCRK